jgi:hypothetical protein
MKSTDKNKFFEDYVGTTREYYQDLIDEIQ